MHWLGRLLAVAALVAGALGAASAAAIEADAQLASAAEVSGCTGYNVGSNSWAVECGNGADSGSGSSGSADVCTYYTLAEAENMYLVSPAVVAEYQAPPGYFWLLQDCPDQYFGDPSILLFADGGNLTTVDLAEQAYAELSPPGLSVGTAPPAGHDGLVGLPEWFWVDAADYNPMSRTVSLDGLSATVTAKPGPLVINPGNGEASFTCPGPGTRYDPSKPAGSQQSDCTFLYTQSSAGQPGDEFTVTVSVTWTATWTGTGGTDGTLAPITQTAKIELPIAQAETVYDGAENG